VRAVEQLVSSLKKYFFNNSQSFLISFQKVC
jgi:hypothetical protein